ncbi:MAG TPA: type IVB secretion system apparatus protein IcmL/DotI [Coxiellaceae bacterium]|nr:type IVB secretion system apparatus protein IcmL/DotI [Coxiellaceae bacterium]
MATERQLAGLRRNEFYRDSYRRILNLLLIFSFISVGLVAVLGVLELTEPQPKYYATLSNGRIVPMQALSEPTVTSNYIMQWASLAVRAAYNLDFVNYQTQLNSAAPYFTTDGWNAFMNALNGTGVISSLQTNKLIMSAVVSDAPIVLDKSIINGHYTWHVQVPLLVTYSSASQNRKQNLVVTLTIVRVSTLNTAQGIQINNFTEAGLAGQ